MAILIALGASTFAVGFASGNWWLSIFAVAVILGTAAGLVFEYHVGPEKH